MNRLDSLTRRLEPQRAALLRRERESRRTLRTELQAPQPDQAVVSRQLDEIQAVQRARLDLHAEEQRRLGEFMTPVQRARYFALQEQFRRRLEQLLQLSEHGRLHPDVAQHVKSSVSRNRV
jgi:Spy/CpxP family protein refolding chaperone